MTALPFKRPATTTPATTAAVAPAPAQRKSRFADVKMEAERVPMPQPGNYRLRLLSHEQKLSEKSNNYTLHLDWGVVESYDDAPKQQAGDRVFMIFPTSGGGARAGLGKIKSLTFALREMEGKSNDELAEACDVLCEQANAFAGSEAIATVRFGNAVVDRKTGQPNGDYYREYAWHPISSLGQAG